MPQKVRHLFVACLPSFPRATEKYEFIKNYASTFSVEKMCIILEISSSSYYTWLNRSISKREIKTSKLCTLIIKEFEDSKKLYGSPRITQQLKRQNIEISRPYVARLMKR